jgi:uncharacterized protein
MEIGLVQRLQFSRATKFGWYLKDIEGKEVFLDEEFLPEEVNEGDYIDVFIHTDENGKIAATTEKPLIQLHQFAALEVKSKAAFGAFLNWGLERDLLVPNVLQSVEFVPGEYHVVYLKLDEKTNKLVGTGIIDGLLKNDDAKYEPGEKVDLLVYDESDLGMKVIVNQKHEGLIFHNEIFKEVMIGDSLRGYIKKVRSDMKIDISLEKFGYRKVEINTKKLLDALEHNNGILYLCDKSNPNEIYSELGISKKVFKKALGGLLKANKVKIDNDECKIELL